MGVLACTSHTISEPGVWVHVPFETVTPSYRLSALAPVIANPVAASTFCAACVNGAGFRVRGVGYQVYGLGFGV